MKLVDWFFKDKNGKVVLLQFPNWPLFGWGICRLAILLIDNSQLESSLNFAGTVFLFIWAGLELLKGVNPFRRILGLIVLALIANLQLGV